MERVNLKWYEVIWSYSYDIHDIEYDEVEAEDSDEAKEKVQILYGSESNEFVDVVIKRVTEMQVNL